MIIRTETYKDLEEDLAIIMDIDKLFLHEKLSEISKECLDRFYSDGDKYEEQIDRLISEYANLNMVDELYIYHLGRHMVEPKELLPLKELLLSENSFSAFLKEHNIIFDEQKGRLRFFYKGQQITAEKILASGKSHLLARRLGYLGEEDFCINGFAFWPNIKKTSDSYFRELQRGPEIIENIERFIRKDLLREFKEQSKYYGIVFKIPVEEVIVDGRDDIETKEEKVRCLLKYALYYLNDFYNNSVCGNNLILRLHNGKRVKVDHCILIDEN